MHVERTRWRRGRGGEHQGRELLQGWGRPEGYGQKTHIEVTLSQRQSNNAAAPHRNTCIAASQCPRKQSIFLSNSIVPMADSSQAEAILRVSASCRSREAATAAFEQRPRAASAARPKPFSRGRHPCSRWPSAEAEAEAEAEKQEDGEGSGAGLVVSSLLGPCPSTPAFRGGRGRAAGQTGANGPKATSASPPADNLWPRVPLRAGVARDAEGRGSGSASALRPNSFFSHNACPQALRSCGQSRLSAKERKSICLGPLTIGWGHVRLPALSRAQASPLQHLQQVGLVLGGPGPPSVQGRDPAAVLVEDDGGGLVDAALAADRLAIVDVHRCEVDLLAARSLAQLREIVARRPAGDGRRGVWPPAVEVHEHVPRP
ncbi:unnamed protein product [Prorocentrum cordatum]|uniref:Uncharacterized protein n=1 Tax=Prorocentrum cordatum TaxID=2364126 RepID=A0ABN9X0J7_9DINO|nr:unnamed protein product [Polarella glacialis]